MTEEDDDMSESTSREEEMAAEITRLRQERPYLDNLFTSFGPMLLQRERWVNRQDTSGKSCAIDPVRFSGGVALVQQCEDFLDDDRWHEAGRVAAGAIGSGLPDLAGDMEYLGDRIRGGLDCLDLYRASVDLDGEELRRRAAETGVKETSLVLFLRCLGRLMLSLRREEMAPQIASLSWKKGYCPICGSFPHLAIIREKGQRWLQCPQCSHEWHYPRMTCPYCEHEDPADSGFLFVEGKKEEMAYTCKKCRRYLVTIDQSGNLRRTSADLLAISLAHLDILVQGQDFQPMAQCEWNQHQDEE